MMMLVMMMMTHMCLQQALPMCCEHRLADARVADKFSKLRSHVMHLLSTELMHDYW